MDRYRKGLHAMSAKCNLKEFEGKDFACMHSIFLQIEQSHLLTKSDKEEVLLLLLEMIEENFLVQKATGVMPK